jgi:hypothetical protein
MPGPPRLVPGAVQLDVAHLEQRAGAAGVAAQQRPHPRLQLLEVERLDQVVVGALVQAGHPVDGAVPGGEHQHPRGLRAAVAAQAPHHVEAVDPRQVQVQADQVVGVDGGLVERRVAVVGDVDGVALAAQAASDRVGQVGLVLDNKHTHGKIVAFHAIKQA